MTPVNLSPRRVAPSPRRIARTGARVWWTTVKFALRVPPPGKRTRAPRMQELAGAAIAGAGIEYLLDPAHGKRRRHVLRDRALANGRRLSRTASRRARYVEGHMEGAVAEATSTPKPPADDQTLADRVRSEIFRRPDAPKDSVNVGVVDRVVHLRGEVKGPEEITRLVEDARKVPGVNDVRNLLHTPGTTAPAGGAA